jgi:hypothetical protein
MKSGPHASVNLIVGAILCPTVDITPSFSKVMSASLNRVSETTSFEPSLNS